MRGRGSSRGEFSGGLSVCDEITSQVTPLRRILIGELLEQLARQQGSGQAAESMRCEVCGEAMEYKGEPPPTTRLKSWTDPP
jgi:hypothetical protein